MASVALLVVVGVVTFMIIVLCMTCVYICVRRKRRKNSKLAFVEPTPLKTVVVSRIRNILDLWADMPDTTTQIAARNSAHIKIIAGTTRGHVISLENGIYIVGFDTAKDGVMFATLYKEHIQDQALPQKPSDFQTKSQTYKNILETGFKMCAGIHSGTAKYNVNRARWEGKGISDAIALMRRAHTEFPISECPVLLSKDCYDELPLTVKMEVSVKKYDLPSTEKKAPKIYQLLDITDLGRIPTHIDITGETQDKVKIVLTTPTQGSQSSSSSLSDTYDGSSKDPYLRNNVSDSQLSVHGKNKRRKRRESVEPRKHGRMGKLHSSKTSPGSLN